MTLKKTIITLAVILVSLCAVANTKNTNKMENKDAVVVITTSLGDITVRLYGDTPKHRDNFLKLVKEGYYD